MAIAFDAVTYATGGTGTSLTFSHTTSGTNRILVVNIFQNDNAGDTTTGVTYGGVAMTRVSVVQNTSSPYLSRNYQYILINPTSGANNVVISNTSNNLEAWALSYTGAKQSSQPDAFTTSTGNVQNFTTTLTTVADNCWTVILGRAGTGGGSVSAGTGTTARGTVAVNEISGDSNGALSAGSNSMTLNFSAGAAQWQTNMLSIAPASVNPNPSVSDTTNITESVSILKTNVLSVSDTTTVTDIAGRPDDSALMFEKVTIIIPNDNVVTSDTTAITESTTIRTISNVSVSDTTTVTDIAGKPDDTAFMLEKVTITIPVLNLSISVSDTTIVTDSATLTVSNPQINTSDTTTVTDSPTISVQSAGTFLISVSDSTNVSDSATLAITGRRPYSFAVIIG